MLEHVIAVIGPPAAGKTMLTSQLGQRPGYSIFRLQEHLPEAPSAATANSEPYERADNFTIIACLHTYMESVIGKDRAHTLLLDGFPGTGTQVSLFVSLLRQLVPNCAVAAVEMAAPEILADRGDLFPGCQARRRRYDELAVGTLRAFATAGIPVIPLDTNCSQEETARRLVTLIAFGKGAQDAS